MYRDRDRTSPSLLTAEQLHGKELSYNNYLDLDAAWRIVQGLVEPAVAVIKHNNPCGVACGKTLAEATAAALAGDPVSAFGSILGCNRTVDEAAARVLVQPGLFIEAIAAPDFSPAAVTLLTSEPKWKHNVRLMRLGPMSPPSGQTVCAADRRRRAGSGCGYLAVEYRRVEGRDPRATER